MFGVVLKEIQLPRIAKIKDGSVWEHTGFVFIDRSEVRAAWPVDTFVYDTNGSRRRRDCAVIQLSDGSEHGVLISYDDLLKMLQSNDKTVWARLLEDDM